MPGDARARRSTDAARGGDRTDQRLDLRQRDRSWAEQRRLGRREIDDGRLDSDMGRARRRE